MRVAVRYLGNRVDRIHVAGLRELQRWPFHGLIGAIAFRFDGRRLELVSAAGKLGAKQGARLRRLRAS